jgi:hypothetical protein
MSLDLERRHDGGERVTAERRPQWRREVVACSGGGAAATSDGGLAPAVAAALRVKIRDWGFWGDSPSMT